MLRLPAFDRSLAATLVLGAASACTTPAPSFEPFSPRPQATAEFSDIPYADWTEAEPDYRFFPGDEVDVVVPTAPELNRSLRVGPDGRITPALAPAVMAADRSAPELESELTSAYRTVLVNPQAQVVLRQAAPLRIYVGGEVANPGEFEMPGDIDALQAIVKAGGFTPSARRFEVVVIRRGPDGRPMMKTVDLLRAVTTRRPPMRCRFDGSTSSMCRAPASLRWACSPSSTSPTLFRSLRASATCWPIGSWAATRPRPLRGDAPHA
jgi:polysaccharide export outer membrane protein